jgi:hypothetical protein
MFGMTNKRILIPVAVALSAVAAALPATALARSSYCSQSGDVCYGVVKNSSPVKLQIVIAARYFNHYRLCIKAPKNRGTECHRFSIHKAAHGSFASTVVWPKHFKYYGKGTYHASWSTGGASLGPAVAF